VTEPWRLRPSIVDGGQRPRLRVEHVAKAYVTHGLWPLTRRIPVLTDASLVMLPGEVVALVGGNGSGKVPSSAALRGPGGVDRVPDRR
jgi:ABC-type glutathione transport system ATPase component